MEINDYVRTKDGKIGKYIEPDLGKPYITNGISFNEGANYGKHSKDIIDLIEEKDVLIIRENGDLYKYEVCNIGFGKKILGCYLSIMDESIFYELNRLQIIGVLTHEQFEANAYTIEKER